jgi:transposase
MLSKQLETASKPDYNVIPVQLSAAEFEEFILPHLSLPKRGPPCKVGYHKPFNYILKVLYTGMQWKELPIDKGPEGKAEIHYTGVFKLFARWAEDGSLEHAFIASVKHLDESQSLDLSLLHGDGSNTVAKKGAMKSATVATSTREVKRGSRLRTIAETFSHP